MNIENIKSKLRESLGDERYRHSVLTADTALKLAGVHGCDLKKTEIAGLLHDCAKGLDTSGQLMLLMDEGFDSELAMVPKVIHGPCGAIIAKRDYGVNDEEILDAIRYHAFGRPAMTLLDKIIFIADAIEPERDFPGVDKLRKVSFKDINRAVLMSLEGTRQKVMEDKELWYAGSRDALEYYEELLKIATGKKYTVEIVNMTHEGKGVARIDDFVVFVDGAITGEKVEIEIIYKTKKYALAKIIRIIDAVPERVEPFCKVYDKCGGCSLQHLRYDVQLTFKQNYVMDCLKRIGGFTSIQVAMTKGMKFPYKYRNKVQYPVENGMAGFYQKRSHTIVEHRLCAIQPDDINEIMNFIKPYLTEEVRHIVFRSGTEGIMMIIVASESIPAFIELTKLVTEKFSIVKTVAVNINSRNTNTILGNQNEFLYGNGNITDRMLGFEYIISPNSFYQVNKEQTKVLYMSVMKMAGLTGKETVFDLYCGIGSIGMYLSRKAGKVIGVESVESAIRDARENAVHNKVQNIEFIHAKAEDAAESLVAKHGHPDVVIVDPPRKGCEDNLLESIKKMMPQKIIYVSCNPATLARDMKILCAGNEYMPGKVQPVDMFPFTSHVETVVLITRVGK
ncbi:MAG: 23S rRNA (uracil(1939)-C(5))-methyltransferase RlmD [Clostridia bacterium]|nr:23S rRNA (uracil(1939)-C(5))-methyltransferase RlmD [Clostridia bacterium]